MAEQLGRVVTQTVGIEFVPDSFAVAATNAIDVDTGSGSGGADFEQRIDKLEKAVLWDPRRKNAQAWYDAWNYRDFNLSGEYVSMILDRGLYGNHLEKNSVRAKAKLEVKEKIEFPVDNLSYFMRKGEAGRPNPIVTKHGDHLTAFVVENSDNTFEKVIFSIFTGMGRFHPRISIQGNILKYKIQGMMTSVDNEFTQRYDSELQAELPEGKNIVVCVILNDVMSIYINGVEIDNKTDHLFSYGVESEGLDHIAVGQGQFNMSEIVHLQQYTCIGDRLTLEGYLAWKWALQDKLGKNHTYKGAAPVQYISAMDFTCPRPEDPIWIY